MRGTVAWKHIPFEVCIIDAYSIGALGAGGERHDEEKEDPGHSAWACGSSSGRMRLVATNDGAEG